MNNLLHFQWHLHAPSNASFVIFFLVLGAALLLLSRFHNIEKTVGTICGWFERKTPDAPTAKPSSVTTGYVFGQRACYVGRNYPANPPDADSFLYDDYDFVPMTDADAYRCWRLQNFMRIECLLPPPGWFCTSGRQHTGPCPARQIPDSILNAPSASNTPTETAPSKRCQWCLDGHPRCWVNGEAFHDGLGFSWRCDETRKASMPAVLGAPYDFSFPAYQAFIGAPPSVNDTVAAQAEPLYRTFVLNRDAFVDPKTCGCTACKDFRNRVFKTDPGALGAPHDEFAARAWQVEQRAAIKREQGLDEARLYLHNQKNCKHPKGFQYLGRCPVCFMAGDSLK